MKFLMYGINYSPEFVGIGKYSGEMARWLVEQGHEVRVITAPPYYPDWKVWSEFSRWRYAKVEESGVTVIRCPLYVPPRPSVLKRMLHLASFSFSSALALLAQARWRPDTLILVVPTLFCAPQALLFARLTGATSVLHIQDYEVDALFGLGCKGVRRKRLALAVERWTLRRFDQISTISGAMLQRARDKGVEESRLRLFPNWSEVGRFRNVRRAPALLRRLGVDPGRKLVLYSGNIGEKQGLEIVLQAAEQMSRADGPMFLIVGEGSGKDRLVKIARTKQLDNVRFAPLQSCEDLPALLASADCHLVIQRRGAADAVLPSKLTNILAVGGNAVITADPGTSLGVLCQQSPGIAQLVQPECVEALVGGIQACLAMPMPNRVAVEYAEHFLDKEQILARFVADHELPAESPATAGLSLKGAAQTLAATPVGNLARTPTTTLGERLVSVVVAARLNPVGTFVRSTGWAIRKPSLSSTAQELKAPPDTLVRRA